MKLIVVMSMEEVADAIPLHSPESFGPRVEHGRNKGNETKHFA